MSQHRGVQVYLPPQGQTFCVRFRQYGKEKRKSLGTSDKRLADEYAEKIFNILKGQPYILGDLPETIRRALELKSDRVKSAEEVQKDVVLQLERVGDSEQGYETVRDYLKLQLVIRNLRRELKEAYATIDELKKEVLSYKALLVASGKSQLAKIETVTLKVGINNYLNSINVEKVTKEQYTKILNSFKEFIHEDVLISKIEPEKVIEFLSNMKSGVLAKNKNEIIPTTIRKMSYVILSMLEKQSGGLYPSRLVKDWRKSHCKTTGKINDDFYWLTSEQVKLLISNIDNNYWKDVAWVQFELALRPSEITLLQACNYDRDNKTLRIAPLFDNKQVLVRRLKTSRSSATLPLSDNAIIVLERRINNKNVLIFPKLKEAGVCRNHKLGGEYEQRINIWQVEGFCKMYIDVLQEAARKAGLDRDRIDARTLRRSRGRMIVLEQGYEKAAALLRDDPQTVYAAYSRFIPTDVKV